MSEQMRAAFEADYFSGIRTCALGRERAGDGYKGLAVQSAWGVWQAAWTASRNQALEDAAGIVDGVCPAAAQLDLRTALAAAIRREKEAT